MIAPFPSATLESFAVTSDVKRLCSELYADRVPLSLHRTSSPTMAADFSRHRNPNHLLVANEAGQVNFLDCNRGGAEALTNYELHAYSNPVFDLRWGGMNDSLYALAVADMHVYIHDAASQATQQCLGHHASSIRNVRFRPSHPHLVVTAGRDGCIGMWDLRECGTNSSRNMPVTIIGDAHQRSTDRGRKLSNPTAVTSTSVTGVEFMPLKDHLVASIGQPDYSIKFWDIRYTWGRKGSPVPLTTIEAPSTGRRQRAFTSLTVDSIGSTLYAVSSDNCVYRYLTSNACSTPLDVYSHPGFRTSGSFYIQSVLSPDDRYLLVGSTEGHAYIWPTTAARKPVVRLAEHRFEVSTVAWSSNGNIFVGGEDYTSRLWWRRRDGLLTNGAIDTNRFVQPEMQSLSPALTVAPARPAPAWKVGIKACKVVEGTCPSILTDWPETSRKPSEGDAALLRKPMGPISKNTLPRTPTLVAKRRQGKLDSFLTRNSPMKRISMSGSSSLREGELPDENTLVR